MTSLETEADAARVRRLAAEAAESLGELVADHLFHGGLAGKREAACQQVVQHAAEAVLIAQRRHILRVGDAFRTGAVQAGDDRVRRRHGVDHGLIRTVTK